MKYLTIDACIGGTGIRDSIVGGYISLSELNFPIDLVEKIEKWLSEYNEEHYSGFKNESRIKELDFIGLTILNDVKELYPHYKVEYFSDALTRKIIPN